MKKLVLGSAIAMVLASPAMAGSIASVFIDGNSFLQSGNVLNNAASSANIVKVVFSLGTAADGIATWDEFGTGTASDFLTDPGWAQTITWDGLSVAAGDSFNFAGLDIDLIETLVPLSVTGGILDFAGTSLANGSFTVYWSDGSSATTALNQTGWNINQSFRLTSGTTDVPEPAALALFGLGIAGMGFARRRRAA